MIFSRPHFFGFCAFESRLVFEEAPHFQDLVVSMGDPEDPEMPLEQQIEDLSVRLASEAFVEVIGQESDLIVKVPALRHEQAINTIRDDIRPLLSGMKENRGRINEQFKTLLRLSAAASARHECERIRLEAKILLLSEEKGRLEMENKALAKKADFDHLTALPNRAALEKRLEEEVARAERSGEPLALLMFDLDRFKEINDQYGHPVGDEVLRALADRFLNGEIGRKVMRETDFVARYGGDEIVFILPKTDKEGAILAAHRIVEALRHEPIVVDNGRGILVKADVGASIGVGIFRGRKKDPTGKNMFADADGCLLTLKGERSDREGVKAPHRGQIAVEGEVFTHEEIERSLTEEEPVVSQSEKNTPPKDKAFKPGPR
jgi:diguanylate cyclase (GGDEF)-like protein